MLLICAIVVVRPGPRSNIAAIATITEYCQYVTNNTIHLLIKDRLDRNMKRHSSSEDVIVRPRNITWQRNGLVKQDLKG